MYDVRLGQFIIIWLKAQSSSSCSCVCSLINFETEFEILSTKRKKTNKQTKMLMYCPLRIQYRFFETIEFLKIRLQMKINRFNIDWQHYQFNKSNAKLRLFSNWPEFCALVQSFVFIYLSWKDHSYCVRWREQLKRTSYHEFENKFNER